MISISVIIPTYNRLSDLKETLPQIIDQLDENSELIVFDQSDTYGRVVIENELVPLLNHEKSIRYYSCTTPSVPYAWNTAAKLAQYDIVLFLDDDINLTGNILEAHRNYYRENPTIVGVAGGYYASSFDKTWIPSSKNGSASTLAGVNTSFIREVFVKSGCASDFIASFAGFDWELAEFVSQNYGEIAVGENALVFHRAPLDGGCQNQGERSNQWYRHCYHNHALWFMFRRFPYNLLHFPKHLYILLKYCTPPKNRLFTRQFFSEAILKGFKDGIRTYKRGKKLRNASSLPTSHFKLVFKQGKTNL